MTELLDSLGQPHNWLYAVSACVAVGIWLVSLLGLVDLHTDGHLAADLHAEAPGLWGHLGEAVGFGALPASVVLTLLLFSFGCTGIALNDWLLAWLQPTGGWRYALLGANFGVAGAVAVGLTRALGRPLRHLFRDYGQAAKAGDLVGRVARVSSGQVSGQHGQATLTLADGTTVEVAVRVPAPGVAPLQYGTPVLLVDFDEDRNVYWVQPAGPELLA
ncbi:MAG: YqiJ family protein [Bernardetiaceae bacterium]|nr:YqiJ family protein [Bernardetiaceae bacterium]